MNSETSEVIICPVCEGKGYEEVRESANTTVHRDCRYCNATGRVIKTVKYEAYQPVEN